MKQKHLKYLRIAVAAIMFALFFAVALGVRQLDPVLVTQFGPGVLRLASVLFLDVLGAVIVIAVVTLLFGRIYCSILCPLGILQDGVAFLTHWNWKKWKWSRYRFMDTRPVKYGVFLCVLILGAAGVMLPLIALLPSSNFFTIVTNVFLKLLGPADPETGAPSGQFAVSPPTAAFFFSLGVFLIVAAMAAWRGRLYCNTLCPVGAVLSLLGRAPLYRISLSQEMCVSCGMCEAACKGGAINAKAKSVLAENCVMCFNCIGACKRGGVKLEKRPKMAAFSLSRRHFIGAAGGVVAGAGAYMVARKLENALPPPPERKPAMPPGAVTAGRFHRKCVGCGICIRQCTGHVLVPAVGQYGLAGFMQPVVDYSRGSCVYDCNRCTCVCPTGALTPLSLVEKRLTRIGVAFVSGSCIGCGVCAEKCPANAIFIESRTLMPLPPDAPQPSARAPRREAETQRKAKVHLDSCIGCGVCQNVCPLPSPAITVSGVTEQILVKPPEVRNEAKEDEAKEEQPKQDAQQSEPSKPVAVINTDECFGCGLCAEDCPLSAITMVDGLPRVNADACVGCGLCASNCPAEAIEIRG